MQSQISNWPTAVTEILKALFYALTIIVPVLITAIVSWKISRHQLTLKEAEMNAEATFKAREHLFQIRRQHLDRHHSEINEATKALGNFIVMSKNIKNDEQCRVLIIGLKTIRETLVLCIDVGGLARGLQVYNLYTESMKEDLDFIRDVLTLNPDELKPDNVSEATMLYFQVFNKWHVIQAFLLEKLCREVFQDYIPKSLEPETKPELSEKQT